MRLEWLRPSSELKEVLMIPNAKGPEVTYWIYSELSKGDWSDMTILAPGTYEGEFTKTYGHYHTAKVLETYKLISGQGLFLLQKKYYENGKWIENRVSEVYLVKLDVNEEIVIPHDFGHSWSNVGTTPLITFDDWRSGHVPTDYEVIKRLHGMSYYIVTNNEKVGFVPNPNYKNLPQPKIITAKEFAKLYPTE